MIIPLLLAASLAQAQTAATVTQLKAVFVESVDSKAKARALEQLAATAPASRADLESLLDLFVRFPIDEVRAPVLASLARLRRGIPDTEPLILRALNDEDPAAALFGMRAAEATKVKNAVPFLRKIAKPKFKYAALEKAPTVGARNAWSVKFEALAALAQLEGAKALPLLKKKSKEAPQVARLMAQYLWADALPTFLRWDAGGPDDKVRAVEALDAPVAPQVLRPARQAMLAVVEDPEADAELRHKLAVKVGACTKSGEVPALLKAYDGAADAYLKSLYATAAFASHDPQVVPLLTRFAKEDPQPNVRAAARVELKELVTPADYRAILEWAAKNDPDSDNRDLAQKELKVLTY